MKLAIVFEDVYEAQEMITLLTAVLNSDLLEREYLKDAYKFHGQVEEWIKQLGIIK